MIENEFDYLQSDKVLKIEGKIFHILDETDNIKMLVDLFENIKASDEHKWEEIVIHIKKDANSKLFVYPVIGDGKDARIGR
jgi:hypothetical protein